MISLLTNCAAVPERPILFSAAMVRAVLAGTKTQTRRAVKWRDLQPGLNLSFSGLEVHSYVPGLFTLEGRSRNSVESRSSPTRCPYGVPGDRLWVREAFSGHHDWEGQPPSDWRGVENDPIWYWADGNPSVGDWTRPKPSIHMPRRFSRITLEVVSVRVERLWDISEADALAEGIDDAYLVEHHVPPPRATVFRYLWEDAGGDWQANPWVWVVEFREAGSVDKLDGVTEDGSPGRAVEKQM